MITRRAGCPRRGSAIDSRPRKRGTVMLLFAMVVVALLGTIAVVIEVGLVRTSRERMQSAADATALEVLRERDYAPTATTLIDPQARDYRRREHNRLFASWTFADQVAGSYAAAEQGAGAYIEVSPGSGDVNLGQRIDGAGHAVPMLETNYAPGAQPTPLNAAHGDIVSGSFTGHSRLPAGEGQEFDPAHYMGAGGSPVYLEGADYSRVDYEPGSAAEAYAQDSVMVRLRRTVSQDFQHHSALDVQENISTSGWTIPLTFGAGTPFTGADPDQGYSIRHHGLPLRATAIAAARPALRAGLPRPDLGPEWGVGVGPITIFEDAWRLVMGGLWSTDDEGNEFIILNIDFLWGLNAAIGDTRLGILQEAAAHRVGDELTALPQAAEPTLSPFGQPAFWVRDEMYVPSVVTALGDEGFRFIVAGFFRLKSELYVDEQGEPILAQNPEYIQWQIKLTRLPNDLSPGMPYIAPRNVSAALDGLQNSDLSPDLWNRVFESLEETTGLVQAPVLVR